MKSFLKFIVSLFALFGAAIGALAVFDGIKNKNRIKGDYLECGDESQEQFAKRAYFGKSFAIL